MGDASKSSAIEELERSARQELTEEFIRTVDRNPRKLEAITAALEDTGLSKEEQIIYFALLHNRAKELEPEAIMLSTGAKYQLRGLRLPYELLSQLP